MAKKTPADLPLPVEFVERRIYRIRVRKAMLDKGLTELYGAPAKSLNPAVKRNLDRLPADVMFRLTEKRRRRSEVAK